MPEYRYARGRIRESLRFVSGEMDEFDTDYADKTWADYRSDGKLQKLTDKTVENILTALIEVCGTVLAEERIAGETYAEVLGKCSGLFGFSEEERENMAKLAVQRNRLVHRYLNFRWHAVKAFGERRGLIRRLLAAVLKREEDRQV